MISGTYHNPLFGSGASDICKSCVEALGVGPDNALSPPVLTWLQGFWGLHGLGLRDSQGVYWRIKWKRQQKMKSTRGL